jgi:hypothetical protein
MGMHNCAYDHMAHPLSVFAMRCVAHGKPHQRATFAEHGKDGFYLGPALNYYRCWRIYIAVTKGTRIADTIVWFPIPYCMPGHSLLEALTAATSDLMATIQTMTVRDTELVGGATVTDGMLHAVCSLRDLYTKPDIDLHAVRPLPYTDVPPGFPPA